LTKIQVLSFIVIFTKGTFGVHIEKSEFTLGDLTHKHCTGKYRLALKKERDIKKAIEYLLELQLASSQKYILADFAEVHRGDKSFVNPQEYHYDNLKSKNDIQFLNDFCR
jgi:hypothetical protein